MNKELDTDDDISLKNIKNVTKKIVNKKRKQINLQKQTAKRINVNIMDEYWNKDKLKIYQDFLTRKGIDNTKNIIFYEYQTRNTVKFNSNKKEFNFNEK